MDSRKLFYEMVISILLLAVVILSSVLVVRTGVRNDLRSQLDELKLESQFEISILEYRVEYLESLLGDIEEGVSK